MPRLAPNFIWRKRVTPQWFAEHELQLDELTRGTHSIVELPGAQRLQVEMFCETLAIARRLEAAFGGASEELPRDWHASFLASHQIKPLRIGRRLVVTTEGKNDDEDKSPRLVIPAGAAFGTGDHATTAMSLRVLERVSRGLPTGWSMLDAGTGSGILALAGKRFGAGLVLAIDNDPTAIRTARENARMNDIAKVKFVVGDVKARLAGTFDIITANLYSELLETVLPQFRVALPDDGRLILSGVMRQQEPKLTKALKATQFRILEARRRGKWVAILAAPRPKTLLTRQSQQKHLGRPLAVFIPCIDAVGSVGPRRLFYAGRRTLVRHPHAVLDAQIAHGRHHLASYLADGPRHRRRAHVRAEPGARETLCRHDRD
jgi:ribosomal protein L11 methyltransferase